MDANRIRSPKAKDIYSEIYVRTTVTEYEIIF